MTKCNTSDTTNYWEEFNQKAGKFMNKTQQRALGEINPGGYYTAIWCRDASFILRDWFLSGTDINKILERLRLIWSHQITSKGMRK